MIEWHKTSPLFKTSLKPKTRKTHFDLEPELKLKFDLKPSPQILVQELSPDDVINWKNDNIIDWKNDDTDTDADTEDINVDTKNKGSIPLQLGPGPGVEVPISNEYEDDNKPSKFSYSGS